MFNNFKQLFNNIWIVTGLEGLPSSRLCFKLRATRYNSIATGTVNGFWPSQRPSTNDSEHKDVKSYSFTTSSFFPVIQCIKLS